ncbi:hypothetical protein NDU88_004136 [Pleurodeles waltl]|uniref:Uncharacterized protein n=1 Tax=Pleurodeles waltl TaxID=8319 RepID=A0AAV7RJF9_PLEWA|nr:hypothetical protein NDU88_004136 [Pleurodeles waltl]
MTAPTTRGFGADGKVPEPRWTVSRAYISKSAKRNRKKKHTRKHSLRRKMPRDNRRSENDVDGRTPQDSKRSVNAEDEKMLLPTR